MTQEVAKINVYRGTVTYASGENTESFVIEVTRMGMARSLYALTREQATQIMEDLRLLLRNEQDPEEK